MFITRAALPRRTFIRGLGATLALPLLDAMVPALTAQARTAAAPTTRLGFIYTPNGYIRQFWVPKGTGAGFEFTPSLAALEPFRDRVLVVSGLASRQADSMGEPPGPHSRSSGAWLTGVHIKFTQGADVRSGVSADQIAAASIGKATPLPSLELGVEQQDQMVGNCEAGYTCVYMNTVSWRDATSPLPMEVHPRVVFERLFGDGTTPAEQRRQLALNRSILDAVVDDIADLRRKIGSSDQHRLAQYLDSVREIESRIQRSEARVENPNVLLPETPVDIPPFEEHVKLMFDLQTLAYQADLTRVITFMIGREQSPRTYPELGFRGGHHAISHHGNDPERIREKAQIDAFHVQLLAYYLERLRSTPDGDGSLLDHVAVLYGSGLGNPNPHDPFDLPAIVFGGGGNINGGRHLAFEVKDNVPNTNLLVSLLNKVGVPVDRLGDSTGRLEGVDV